MTGASWPLATNAAGVAFVLVLAAVAVTVVGGDADEEAEGEAAGGGGALLVLETEGCWGCCARPLAVVGPLGTATTALPLPVAEGTVTAAAAATFPLTLVPALLLRAGDTTAVRRAGEEVGLLLFTMTIFFFLTSAGGEGIAVATAAAVVGVAF